MGTELASYDQAANKMKLIEDHTAELRPSVNFVPLFQAQSFAKYNQSCL